MEKRSNATDKPTVSDIHAHICIRPFFLKTKSLTNSCVSLFLVEKINKQNLKIEQLI